MLTLNSLKEFGADVQDGLKRCLNNEGFYLKLVNMAINDGNFDKLAAAVGAGDKKAAFEAAHALKGIAANVSLTPIYAVVSEMTELLRADQDADYQDYLDRILKLRGKLITLRDN
ncbi:MAG: Hpt domain-containing protein [Anaerolineaceae bacterium]|nr:Hpt domain-containing protein [Anaerolineaceae bacterium]